MRLANIALCFGRGYRDVDILGNHIFPLFEAERRDRAWPLWKQARRQIWWSRPPTTAHGRPFLPRWPTRSFHGNVGTENDVRRNHWCLGCSVVFPTNEYPRWQTARIRVLVAVLGIANVLRSRDPCKSQMRIVSYCFEEQGVALATLGVAEDRGILCCVGCLSAGLNRISRSLFSAPPEHGSAFFQTSATLFLITAGPDIDSPTFQASKLAN